MIAQDAKKPGPKKTASPGRPRSEAARRAILEAAYSLVIARGYQQVTMAEIAAAAGSGKQTIYRWWPSKPALVLDALEQYGEETIDPERPEDRSLAGFFHRVCVGASRAAPVLRSLMAEAQFDALLRAELKERLVDRRRAALDGALRRWGIDDAAQRETLILGLYGALWYRLLLDEPLDAAFAGRILSLVDPARGE